MKRHRPFTPASTKTPAVASASAHSAGNPALSRTNVASESFRRALSQFATGVTVITTRSESGELAGLTASSFNSVSLTPPLILWSLALHSSSLPLFQANSHYAVNVLSSNQFELSLRFAAPIEDRFAGIPYQLSASGTPILEGALAWFECHNRSRYTEGDHIIFVGEVENCGHSTNNAGTNPLIFHGGRFHTINPLE